MYPYAYKPQNDPFIVLFDKFCYFEIKRVHSKINIVNIFEHKNLIEKSIIMVDIEENGIDCNNTNGQIGYLNDIKHVECSSSSSISTVSTTITDLNNNNEHKNSLSSCKSLLGPKLYTHI